MGPGLWTHLEDLFELRAVLCLKTSLLVKLSVFNSYTRMMRDILNIYSLYLLYC